MIIKLIESHQKTVFSHHEDESWTTKEYDIHYIDDGKRYIVGSIHRVGFHREFTSVTAYIVIYNGYDESEQLRINKYFRSVEHVEKHLNEYGLHLNGVRRVEVE